MSGTLFTHEGAHRVRIRDIAPTGAHIVAADPISAECDAIFKRGPLFAAARVAWSRKNDIGIHFYRELTPDEMDSLLEPVLRLAG
jgi:hypothetical protein